MSSKKKMSQRKFTVVMTPLLAICMGFGIAATCITDYFTPSLDTFLGKGERVVTAPEGSESWDTNYYTRKASNQTEARNNSAKVAEKIANEGEVLLKNNGILPLKKSTKVSPMGYRYIAPVMSGSGSGSTNTSLDYVYNAERGIKEAFTNVNETIVNAMKKGKEEKNAPKDRKVLCDSYGGSAFLGAALPISEYPVSVYSGTEDSCKDTVGIVFIGRNGGEGGDLYAKEYMDGTPHALALTQNEKDMIAFAEKYCTGGVVVVLNSANPMQLGELEDDDKIGAILQICTPGAMGFKSVGNILNGTVNPSGRTVDTFIADLTKSPTYCNFDDYDGVNSYSNTLYHTERWLTRFYGSDFMAPFHEYEEGIYLGYRFYETASEVGGYFSNNKLPDGVTDNYYNRENGVIYPLGYGLSYTQFEQSITKIHETAKTVELTISVKNVGNSYSGKEVVQVYYSAPYTKVDEQYQIEKASANLIAYAKTSNLAPEASEEVKLTIEKEEMASYCYTRDNPNGTKGCYMLEEGDYTLSIRSDSHNVIDSRTINIATTTWYDGSDAAHIRNSEKLAQSALDEKGNSLGYPAAAESDPTATYIAATNQFEICNRYMTDPTVGNDVTILSRSNWNGTQPSEPTNKTRTASAEVKAILDKNWTLTYDPTTDPDLGNTPTSKIYVPDSELPKANQKNGLTLSDMRGKSYYDDAWELLLDQIDYDSDQINTALFVNGYASGALDSVGKMATSEHDGPQGIGLNGTDGSSWVACCSFPAATTLAQTWNTELAYEFGNSVAEENMWINGGGWYAPAVNLHWSQFGGRNYEYYSEDPLISGMMAAAVISGAGDNGTYCAFKHFAMIETENERWFEPSVWATEQAIRELYLKAFEIGVKNATKTIKYISDNEGTVSTKVMRAADCMMTSGWSSIGGTYAGYDYNLNTNVLRNEWGFQGFIITDYDGGNYANDDSRVARIVRAGVDQHMIDGTMGPGKYTDVNSATGRTALRKAIKNTLFTLANSAQTNNAAPGAIISYKMSPWRIGIICMDVALGLFIAGGIVWIILRNNDSKKNPDRYKSKND